MECDFVPNFSRFSAFPKAFIRNRIARYSKSPDLGLFLYFQEINRIPIPSHGPRLNAITERDNHSLKKKTPKSGAFLYTNGEELTIDLIPNGVSNNDAVRNRNIADAFERNRVDIRIVRPAIGVSIAFEFCGLTLTANDVDANRG